MKKNLLFLTILTICCNVYSQENCNSSRIKYLEANPDVKNSTFDPWYHYTTYGKKEGRVWAPCSDEKKRDSRPKDQANVFWNGAFNLYSLTSDIEILPNSSGEYVFWGTTNENPVPTEHKMKIGTSKTVYKFIDYRECVLFCNEVRKAKGMNLLEVPSQTDKKIVISDNAQNLNVESKIKENVNTGLVKIGNYYWQNQNCRITKYMNGDPIFFAKNSNDLNAANKRKEGAYCFVDFNNKLDSNYIIYNWYAFMDSRGFGTKESKIPTWYEWKNLISTLEKDKKTHNDLKKVESWDINKSFPASNYYGFNGTPCFYGVWSAAYQQENFKKSNGMFFWLPNPDVDVQFKIGEEQAFMVKFLNDGWSSKYSSDYKASMFPVRLIKGEVSYFDGKVISGKKEGNGKMYVRSDDYYHWDYVNDGNVQSGSVIQGNWINNKLEGKAIITWSDGASEEVLFNNNLHQGAFKIVDNKTQLCLFDGKSFNSKYKKNETEIQQEKTATKSIRIYAYKLESFCNSSCNEKAIAELIAREKSRESQPQISNNTSNSTPVKSKMHVYVCDDCGKIQTSESRPYDKSTCPETRWGGIGGAGNLFDDGDHSYTDFGNSGSQQFVCGICNISIMIYEKPQHEGACGPSGLNINHSWKKN